MKRTIALALAGGLLAGAALPSVAWAHGGGYRDAPAEPSTPPPNSGPMCGPRTGKPVDRVAWDDWPVWWGHAQDEILAARPPRLPPRSDAFGRSRGKASLRVSRPTVDTAILPLLRASLRDDDASFHIRSAAALALAKAGDTSVAPCLRSLVAADADRVHVEVAEAAVLALGLAPDDPDIVRSFLVSLLLRREDEPRRFVRPFAAVSLGLLGRAGSTPEVARTALLDVGLDPKSDDDLRAVCLLALGLLGDDAVVPDLVALLRGRGPGARRPSANEAAFAVEALGRIGARGERDAAFDVVVGVVEKRIDLPGLDARRSAVTALGRFAAAAPPPLRRRALDALRDAARYASDVSERCFALVALARFAADRETAAPARTAVFEILRDALDDDGAVEPAFAALGLGILGNAEQERTGFAPEESVRTRLRDRFHGDPSPPRRGAYALASGLLGDPLAAQALRGVLADPGEARDLRGWCALALGLIGDDASLEPLRTAYERIVDRVPRLRITTALGLLGRPEPIDDLCRVLADADASNYELGSAALALGRIGDERAVAPLVAIARDAERFPDLTRGLALVALGELAARERVASFARIASGINYRVNVPAIRELLTIL